MDCFSALSSSTMLNLTCFNAVPVNRLMPSRYTKLPPSIVVCAAKGPRPRYPRVWKSRPRIGTISKSIKLVECIKGLSNVKEEVYGALDSFIAWDLDFPLITVKKALKTLENEGQWKRIIQVTKWMLSKGQGKTMGTYYLLLHALYEDGRLDEAEELWTKLFSERLASMPKMFFQKMISIYSREEMHDKMFEVFADMEELGLQPTPVIIKNVGDVFEKLGMTDKVIKLKEKYPTPDWEYRFVKGKRVKIRRQDVRNSNFEPYYRKSKPKIVPDSNGSTEDDENDIVVMDDVEDEDDEQDENEGVETDVHSVLG